MSAGPACREPPAVERDPRQIGSLSEAELEAWWGYDLVRFGQDVAWLFGVHSCAIRLGGSVLVLSRIACRPADAWMLCPWWSLCPSSNAYRLPLPPRQS